MKSLILALALVTATYGCASETAGDADAQDVTAGRAQVTSQHIENWSGPERQCLVDVTFFQVKGTKADDVINKALALEESALLADANCKGPDAYQVTGKSLLNYNGHGLLSVSMDLKVVDVSKDREFHKISSLVFDLDSGRQLEVSDVLDKDGMSKLSDACRNVYAGYRTDSAACSQSTTFGVDPEGVIFFQPNAPDKIVNVDAFFQLVKWEKLTVLNTKVQAIAAESK